MDEDRQRRIRDAATVLPFVATILLMPPIVLIFARPVFVAGVPLIVVFIFGAWAVLVLAAFLVARCQQKAEKAALTARRTVLES